MNIKNSTTYHPEPLLEKLVDGFDTSDLKVEIKHSRGDQKWTGTYYWDRRLIRVRINATNPHPCVESFATGDYLERSRRGPYEYWSQRLQLVEFTGPEELIAGGFLHEFSHYLDHRAGRNPRWKQTKADKFALEMMREHRIGRFLT